MFSQIVVPLDGSPLAETALDQAVGLAQLCGARLHLVRASEIPVIATAGQGVAVPAGAELERRNQLAEEYLEAVQRRLAHRGLECTTATDLGDPVLAVREQVESTGADLVVIASHGRTGLPRFFLGSVAEAISRDCPCPVMIVTAQQTASVQ